MASSKKNRAAPSTQTKPEKTGGSTSQAAAKTAPTLPDKPAPESGPAAPPVPVLPAPPRRAPVGRSPQSRPIAALFLLLAAVLLLMALLDYNPRQPFFFDDGLFEHLNIFHPKSESNIIGVGGTTVAVLLLNFAGLAAFFTPFCMVVAAWCAFFGRARKIFPWRVVRMLVAFLALATLFDRLCPNPHDNTGFVAFVQIHDFVPWRADGAIATDADGTGGTGGVLGFFIYREFTKVLFGPFGSLIFFLIIYAYCMVGLFVDSPTHAVAVRLRWLRDEWLRRNRKAAEKNIAASPNAPSADFANTDDSADNTASTAVAAVAASAGNTPPTAAVPTDFPSLPDSLRSTAADDAAAHAAELANYDAGGDPLAKPLQHFGGLFDDNDDDALAANAADNDDLDGLDTPRALSTTTPTAPDAAKTAASSRTSTNASASAAADATDDEPSAEPTVIAAEVVERADDVLEPKRRGDYQLPPITILKEPPPREAQPQEDYSERMVRLINTLNEFKVKVTPGDIQAGPVITRYEVIPAAGVRVEKIAGLANNIALNLKAESVRVIAPVPGKGTVGLEIPNKSSKPVYLREIIESKQWVEERGKCKIPIVLGKDVTGKPIIADLAKMPHCLIAGSTGSGKSVCINSIVASLAYHAGPEDIRLVMVDPKVVELQVYNRLPHMWIPVETDPGRVPAMLKALIKEMMWRYDVFAKAKVRNISGFNAKISKDCGDAESVRLMEMELSAELSPEERAATVIASSVPREAGVLEEDELPKEKLPYIVCIIDELADLMMTAPGEIEAAIMRLAQLARAAGIHLILATQRPSVDIITGKIKSNLPCRISFKTVSGTDSRTILDHKGAETLIGKGDMLFIPPGTAQLVRAQGAFLSDDEVEALVNAVAEANGEPEFDMDFMQAVEAAAADDDDAEDNSPSDGTDDDEEDPMFKKAWDVVRTSERASTSLLQRKLGIGYGRAAKIIDEMEQRGYIGPDPGPGKQREILVK